MRLFDAHCHLQDDRLAPELADVLRRAAAAGVERFCCCAADEAEWSVVAGLARRHPGILPAYGLHPGRLATRMPGWESRLRARLIAEPAAGVGEIGLDHTIPSPSRADQESVFQRQMALAAELDRPVSIHCRQAWGAMLDCLRRLSRRPPALIFHAYSGSAELIPELAALGGYLSFAGSLTRPGNKRGRAAAAAAPEARLLLESDAPDLSPHPADPAQPNEPARIRQTLATLASIRGWTPEAAADQTWRNARRAFDRVGA